MKRIIFLLIIVILLTGCGRLGAEYFEDLILTNDDGSYSVTIREWGTMGGSGAEVYYNGKLIGETAADDACYPFRDGNYLVEWKENGIIISYYSGRNSQSLDDKSTWEKVEFDFE